MPSSAHRSQAHFCCIISRHDTSYQERPDRWRQTDPQGAAIASKSDVFVSDNKISAIGNFPNKKADMVLDGQGAYLSPGSSTCNTDSDHYLTLFDNPSQEDFLRQGVTTIMGGMCGASLAPLLYGSLESFQKWGDTNRVNVNWHTMAEFLAVMDKRTDGGELRHARRARHGPARDRR